MRKLIHILSLSLVFIMTAHSVAHAAEVLKVKGDALLIDTAGDNIKSGETYYLVTNGSKKGIVKIIKIRPGQALAKLVKGKALPNWTLQKRSSGLKRSTVTKTRKRTAPKPKLTKKPYRKKRKAKKKLKGLALIRSKVASGIALGFNQNNAEVEFGAPAARTDNYTGTSLSFESFLDYQVNQKWSLRGSLGMHKFEAGGDTSNTACPTANGTVGAVCVIDLTYMNLDIWARYHFLTKKKYTAWGGAGLGILFVPEFGKTTALSEQDLATTTLIQVGGGLDIKLTEKLFFPVWGEYGLFPSSDTVNSMNSLSFYFGLGYRL